jgi:acetolactate synthase I/II/III large subunit
MNKPLILLGNGARHNPALLDAVKASGIPVMTTWMAMDLIPDNHPSFCGRPGLIGQRAANIIVQKASILYVFGARLDNETIGYRYDNFVPNGSVVVFDADAAELNKLPPYWTRSTCDLRASMPTFHEPADPDWLQWCKSLYSRLGVEYDPHPDYVDPPMFIDWLSGITRPGDVFAIGSSGQAPCTFLQGFKVKDGQRIVNGSTYGAMGADIPMSIGACIASGKRRTICVTGDGGFMLNMQELEVVSRLELPIKYFVYSNGAYNSIRQAQLKRFGRVTAADPDSGFTIPELDYVGACFSIPYTYIPDNEYLLDYDRPDFDDDRPHIFELNISPDYVQYPRVDSSMSAAGVFQPDSFEDMTPKLDELDELMRY